LPGVIDTKSYPSSTALDNILFKVSCVHLSVSVMNGAFSTLFVASTPKSDKTFNFSSIVATSPFLFLIPLSYRKNSYNSLF